MDSLTKREIILDNYSNPFNKVTEEVEGYLKENSRNESCIDNIDLYIDIKDDVIKDIKFSGEACAISTASTSIMIKNLIGKSVNEALEYMTEFDNMLEEKEFTHTANSAVKLTLKGDMSFVSLEFIEPSMLEEDNAEMIADIIKIAYEAIREEILKEEDKLLEKYKTPGGLGF